MKDAFTSQQLAKMRDEYGKISTIDPSGSAYKQLIAMLDKMNIDNLKSLAGAKIKFVSGLAQNRVNRAAMKKEEVDLEESKSGTGYELYHKDFSSAMAHAYDFAKKKYHIEIDPFEIDRNVAMGPKKPSSGKANAYRLLDKTGKKAIQVQVTNLDNKRYELNMYKEDIDEACWDTHKQVGMKKKGNRMVPDCRPKNEASSPAQQAAIAIAMKKAGKKPKDMEESDAYDKNVKPSNKPHDKLAAAKRAMLAALAARKKMKGEQTHPEDEKTSANKLEPEGTKKWLATTKFKKEIKEAEGGGTSVRSASDATDAVKRAQVQLKSTQLQLKHQKEREAMSKQRQSLRKEEDENAPLAKKFEKAFSKMGIKTSIKMKTVDNVSINEKEDKKDKEAPAKQKIVKKGETLSGKQEPIKIDPEIDTR